MRASMRRRSRLAASIACMTVFTSATEVFCGVAKGSPFASCAAAADSDRIGWAIRRPIIPAITIPSSAKNVPTITSHINWCRRGASTMDTGAAIATRHPETVDRLKAA